MRIVGFLQNPGFDVNTKPEIIARYGLDDLYRKTVLAHTMSGKKLIRTLGFKLYYGITWDNACPLCNHHPSYRKTADVSHMQSVLTKHGPELVLCYGNTARNAINDVWSGPLICAPHPNARYTSDEVFRKVKDKIQEHINGQGQGNDYTRTTGNGEDN